MHLPTLSAVDAAIEKLTERLVPVESQRIAIDHIYGRILAEDLRADRASPPLDVSAMDGYALRAADHSTTALPVSATAVAGAPPLKLSPGHAIRIFTGAPIPAGADCVVRREDTTELASTVMINLPADEIQAGKNIRRQGENSPPGEIILPRGAVVSPAAIAAVASFGRSELMVQRKVRLSILNTGDELVAPGHPVDPWQIRDSNGPALAAWLADIPWIEVVTRQHVDDSLAAVNTALASQLPKCDAIVLTGGVSMGDTDFVPAAIEGCGGEVVFHRLPIRPGKPVLGAALDGKLVLGLPGNPVSVAVTARVFGMPLLLRLADCTHAPRRPWVTLSEGDSHPVDLTCYRPVAIDALGNVRLLTTQGSGDLVSLSRSHGFVEIPPGITGCGPFRLTLW